MTELLVFIGSVTITIGLFCFFMFLGNLLGLTQGMLLYKIVMSLYVSILTASFIGFTLNSNG